jgi:uncharacterized membrane protein
MSTTPAKPGLPPTSRIEAFSDAVFAISATLLVVSLEVPKDFAGLMANIEGAVAFALSFAIFVQIWVSHHRYFRDFPLADGWNVALNSLLLFVVLLFVYPLKFLMLGFVYWMFGIGEHYRIELRELDYVFAIYGVGWLAVFLCFTGLYWRAARQHVALGLTPERRADAMLEAQLALTFGLVGAVSALLALAGLTRYYGLPGFLYAAMGPIGYWSGSTWERRRAALVARYANG